MKLEFLRHNLALKLLSLLLGTSLYVYLQSLETAKTTKSFQVPLRVDASNPNLIYISATDEEGRRKREIEMTMRGPADELAELDAARIQKTLVAWVDMSEGEPGDHPYRVHVRWGKEYDKYEWTWDRQIHVFAEKVSRETKPVTVVTTGASQVGVDYGNSLVDPSSVEVVGAESAVSRVKTVRVLLDLQKTVSGVEESITVEMLDANERPVNGVTANPSKVAVKPVLTPSAPWREAFVAPAFVGAVPPGYRIVSYKATPDVVRIQGDPKRLRLQGTVSTTAIDVSGQTRSFEREVEVIVPRGLRANPAPRIRVSVVVEPDPQVSTRPPNPGNE